MDLELDFYTVGVGSCSSCWATYDGRPQLAAGASEPLVPDHQVGGSRINGIQLGGHRCEGSGEVLWGWRADGAGLTDRRA